MWDEYLEIADLNSEQTNGIQTLYLFKNGGMVFTASTLMKEVINDLENFYLAENKNDFTGNSPIKVSITSPEYDGEKYEDMINSEEYSAHLTQQDLEKRWNKVRSISLEEGKMSVHANQA